MREAGDEVNTHHLYQKRPLKNVHGAGGLPGRVDLRLLRVRHSAIERLVRAWHPVRWQPCARTQRTLNTPLGFTSNKSGRHFLSSWRWEAWGRGARLPADIGALPTWQSHSECPL